jgi:hypothetical protein
MQLGRSAPLSTFISSRGPTGRTGSVHCPRRVVPCEGQAFRHGACFGFPAHEELSDPDGTLGANRTNSAGGARCAIRSRRLSAGRQPMDDWRDQRITPQIRRHILDGEPRWIGRSPLRHEPTGTYRVSSIVGRRKMSIRGHVHTGSLLRARRQQSELHQVSMATLMGSGCVDPQGTDRNRASNRRGRCGPKRQEQRQQERARTACDSAFAGTC